MYANYARLITYDRVTMFVQLRNVIIMVAKSHSTRQNVKCIQPSGRMSLDFRAVESGCIFCAGGGHEGAN